MYEAKLDLDEAKKLSARLDIMRRAYPKAAHAALVTVANETMQEVVTRAPVDTGFLRSSGYIKVSRTVVRFGLGAWYAAILNGRDNLRTARPRFFTSTLEDLFPTYLGRLTALTSDYIRRGVTEVRPWFPPSPIGGDGHTKRRSRRAGKVRLRLSRRTGTFLSVRKKRGSAQRSRRR